MSGTHGGLSNKGGVSLPQPQIRFVTNDNFGSGGHDRVVAGGLTDSQWDSIKDLNPRIWLFRYKTAHTIRNPHSGSPYDHSRGYVHPAHGGKNVALNLKYSGGSHNSRSGATLSRATEWPVTKSFFYDAVFEPELWFLQPDGATQLNYPIQPIATSVGNEYLIIGGSGQRKNMVGTSTDQFSNPVWCCSGQVRGVQHQFFAMAYVVQGPNDTRDVIVGPLSEVFRAQIWPKVKVNYGGCLPVYDRGRKIRLTHK